MDKFKCIYADPPWSYRDKRNKHPRLCGGAEVHYKTMSLKDIQNIPVQKITDKNCLLFLWVTFPNLKEGIETLEKWGFRYKTIGFNWIKTNKNDGKPFFGIGWYTKSNSEICLIGIKGKPTKASNSVSSIVIEPRGEHSAKPNEVRKRIEQFVGDVPKIELFARHKVDGWTCVGNEIDGRDIVDVLNELGGDDE